MDNKPLNYFSTVREIDVWGIHPRPRLNAWYRVRSADTSSPYFNKLTIGKLIQRKDQPTNAAFYWVIDGDMFPVTVGDMFCAGKDTVREQFPSTLTMHTYDHICPISYPVEGKLVLFFPQCVTSYTVPARFPFLGIARDGHWWVHAERSYTNYEIKWYNTDIGPITDGDLWVRVTNE